MNNLISFKLAKLLKEKGFDESCNYIFDNGQEKYLGGIQRKNSTYENVITRPIIAEVVMWLYEKHGIWIFAFSYSRRWQWKIDSDSSTAEYSRGDGFNSPTEAYEAAIEYTIKNLIK